MDKTEKVKESISSSIPCRNMQTKKKNSHSGSVIKHVYIYIYILIT
jgi:hypothetical protein